MSDEVVIQGQDLNIDQVYQVAVNGATVAMAEACRDQVDRSCQVVRSLVEENKPVYGVTTGVGPLCNRLLPTDQAEALQKNIVRALSAGVGTPLSAPLVRASMLVRANSLMRGHSGIRWTTLQTLVDMINRHLHPVIPETGSVGASGDLAHLGHIARGLMGEGRVEYQGAVVDCRDAMRQAGIEPVMFTYKEGLALVNGTSFMTGVGSVCAVEAEYMTTLMECCTAFLVEVFGRSLAPFDLRIHQIKPFPGQLQAAKNILHFARNSRLIIEPEQLEKLLEEQKAQSRTELIQSSEDIQDPYSIRCVPQVTGAARDHLVFIRQMLEIEINSTNDNPLIFVEDRKVAHGGNFLGQHVAFVMDTLSLILSQLATLCERQFARLIDEKFNFDLPPMLISGEAGVSSGFMPVQLVATSLSANIRVRAAPASIQSIPTNANNQDIVTMGGIAAMKNVSILKDLSRLIAIQLVGLCQAVDLKKRVDDLGDGTRSVYQLIREQIPFVDEDRSISDEIEELAIQLREKRLNVDRSS